MPLQHLDRSHNLKELDYENNNFQLVQIFESAADGMCIIDNDFTIIKASARLQSLLGVKEEEIIDRKCYEFNRFSICGTGECPIERIKNGENCATYQINKSIADKKISLLITATPLFNKEKQIIGTILSFKDITALIKNQEELEEAKLKAEEANMLKGIFLANMSHEIRTPINGIIGLIELLNETKLDHIQREYIDMLKFSANRLLSVINDILDLSKIEAGKFQLINNKFNLTNLLNNIANYFKFQANRKGLKFYYKTDGKMPRTVIGDSDRLSQVLFNLLDNAIKFTEHGSVSFEAEVKCEDMDYTKIRFSIRDTGIGIADEKLKLLFRAFNQLDSSYAKKQRGTGLGLFISKNIVELMGGEIKVNSKLGEGSSFYIDIKFANDKSEGVNIKLLNSEESSHRNSNGTGLNVLMVEDDLVNQKIIKKLLEKNNWKVTVVSNGNEALEYLERKDFDLIIMDIYMPDMNGFEVAKRIREKELISGRYTPIIALTAAAMKEDMERCLEIGMDGYISKPIRSETVYQTINHILNRQKSIEVLNIKDILDKVDGDKEVFFDIVNEVLSDSYEKDYLHSIGVYIENNDLAKLGKQLHKLKGSMSNFGAYKLVNILKSMEESIKVEDLSVLKKAYEDLLTEFSKIKNSLREYIRIYKH